MSLLNDIQTEASGNNPSLPPLLRKCLLLANRLGAEDLEQWANKELNGYHEKDQLPDYRILRNFPLHGKFFNPASRKPVPLFGYAEFAPDSIPEDLRTIAMPQPVANLLSILPQTVRFSFGSQYHEQLRPAAQYDAPDLICTEVGTVIPAAMIRALLDSILTRILSFTVALQKKFPDLDVDAGIPTPSPQQKEILKDMVSTTIYLNGNNAMLAIGNANINQTTTINPDPTQLFSDVIAAIKHSQESQDAKDRLTAAVEEMQRAHGTPTFADRYKSFMSTAGDHAQVWQVLAPYLAPLAALLAA